MEVTIARSAWFIDVIAHDRDADAVRELRRAFVWAPPALRRWTLTDAHRASDDGILLWSNSTATDPALSALIPLAIEKNFLVLPLDKSPSLKEWTLLRRLEWTNAEDIYWQWRVANGAPADHVNRPLD